MSRRDKFLVAFLIFNSVVAVLSLLFGDKLQSSSVVLGVSKSLFGAYLVFVAFVVLGSLGLVSWFVFGRHKDVVVTIGKDEKKFVPDEEKRLRIEDEVEKSKLLFLKEEERERELLLRSVPQPRRVEGDGNTYYDNGYYDSSGVFHEYGRDE